MHKYSIMDSSSANSHSFSNSNNVNLLTDNINLPFDLKSKLMFLLTSIKTLATANGKSPHYYLGCCSSESIENWALKDPNLRLNLIDNTINFLDQQTIRLNNLRLKLSYSIAMKQQRLINEDKHLSLLTDDNSMSIQQQDEIKSQYNLSECKICRCIFNENQYMMNTSENNPFQCQCIYNSGYCIYCLYDILIRSIDEEISEDKSKCPWCRSSSSSSSSSTTSQTTNNQINNPIETTSSPYYIQLKQVF